MKSIYCHKRIACSFIAKSALIVFLTVASHTVQAQEEPPSLPESSSSSSASAITDDDLIKKAVEAVELLSTYDASSAEPRFRRLATMMTASGRTALISPLIEGELPVIQSTRRVQRFIIDQTKTAIEHFPDLEDVVVRLTGRRSQWVELRAQPAEDLTYHVNLELEKVEPGRRPKIFIKDIKARPAAEQFAFPGHISNKTRWMNEYEEKTSQIQSSLQTQQAGTEDLVRKLTSQIDQLTKRADAAESKLENALRRIEKLEEANKASTHQAAPDPLRERIGRAAEDSFSLGQ